MWLFNNKARPSPKEERKPFLLTQTSDPLGSTKESEKAGADASEAAAARQPPFALLLHLPQGQALLCPAYRAWRKTTSAQGFSMAAKGSGYPGLIHTCGRQMEAGDHDTEVITQSPVL